MAALTSRSRRLTTITRTTPIADLPQFLSVEEFADYLGIGKGLAYEMARSDPRLRATVAD